MVLRSSAALRHFFYSPVFFSVSRAAAGSLRLSVWSFSSGLRHGGPTDKQHGAGSRERGAGSGKAQRAKGKTRETFRISDFEFRNCFSALQSKKIRNPQSDSRSSTLAPSSAASRASRSS